MLQQVRNLRVVHIAGLLCFLALHLLKETAKGPSLRAQPGRHTGRAAHLPGSEAPRRPEAAGAAVAGPVAGAARGAHPGCGGTLLGGRDLRSARQDQAAAGREALGPAVGRPDAEVRASFLTFLSHKPGLFRAF